MYNYPQYPPPPPPPMGGYAPPPPPSEHMRDPLSESVDWFVDVPAGNVPDLFRIIPNIQSMYGTRLSLYSGGDETSMWARLCVQGSPVGIHYTVAEIFKTFPCQEVGYSPDQPFPTSHIVQEDSSSDQMPAYHSAWVQYNLTKRP